MQDPLKVPCRGEVDLFCERLAMRPLPEVSDHDFEDQGSY